MIQIKQSKWDAGPVNGMLYAKPNVNKSPVGEGGVEWVEPPPPILEDPGIWRSRIRIRTSQFSNPGQVKPMTLRLILVAP